MLLFANDGQALKARIYSSNWFFRFKPATPNLNGLLGQKSCHYLKRAAHSMTLL